jgi:branched-subunit amino acid transport protein
MLKTHIALSWSWPSNVRVVPAVLDQLAALYTPVKRVVSIIIVGAKAIPNLMAQSMDFEVISSLVAAIISL